MDNLKKFFVKIKGYLTIFLFFIFLIIPAISTVSQGESFMVQDRFDEAISSLSPFAAKRDPRALYLLGSIYLSPKSKHYNAQKGIELIERAVFLNYGPALDLLAGLYLAGEGVEKNEVKALHYYIQASHIGYGPSQFNCGIMYMEGQGTKKDPVKAYLYLSLAALNYRDLEDVTIDAANYRDQLVPLLTKSERQDLLRQINSLTIPDKSRKVER